MPRFIKMSDIETLAKTLEEQAEMMRNSAKKLEKSAEMLRNGVAESPESTSSTKSYTGKKRGRPSKADLEARAAVQKSKIASEDEEADKVLDEVLSAEEEDKISVLGQAAVHAEEEQVVGKIELA